jgi:hypothetical protein
MSLAIKYPSRLKMFYPKIVKMKLYLKFIFNEFEASILSNIQMIYKLFPEMNYILQRSKVEKS